MSHFHLCMMTVLITRTTHDFSRFHCLRFSSHWSFRFVEGTTTRVLKSGYFVRTRLIAKMATRVFKDFQIGLLSNHPLIGFFRVRFHLYGVGCSWKYYFNPYAVQYLNLGVLVIRRFHPMIIPKISLSERRFPVILFLHIQDVFHKTEPSTAHDGGPSSCADPIVNAQLLSLTSCHQASFSKLQP